MEALGLEMCIHTDLEALHHLPIRGPYVGYSSYIPSHLASPSHGSSMPRMVASSGLGYTSGHEMGLIPSGGHQLMPNQHYFG